MNSEMESFVFFKSFRETIRMFPKEERLGAYEALLDCAFGEADPSDYDFPLNAVLDQILIGINAARKRYKKAIESGKKGGKSKKSVQEINAIETVYNGYKFRSRLEARWAVFFDAAGIPYQYEPEGFCGSDGTSYLPDFYLPWFSAYVEIKPTSVTIEDDKAAREKCEMVCKGKDCIALLCFGDPLNDKMEVFCRRKKGKEDLFGWFEAHFVEGGWFSTYDEDLGYDVEHSSGKHWINISVLNFDDNSFVSYVSSKDENKCCLMPQLQITSYRSELDEMKVKARQARFEFGERG